MKSMPPAYPGAKNSGAAIAAAAAASVDKAVLLVPGQSTDRLSYFYGELCPSCGNLLGTTIVRATDELANQPNKRRTSGRTVGTQAAE